MAIRFMAFWQTALAAAQEMNWNRVLYAPLVAPQLSPFKERQREGEREGGDKYTIICGNCPVNRILNHRRVPLIYSVCKKSLFLAL